MPRAFIAAGSNLGDRLGALESAFSFLCRQPSFQALRKAGVYETAPVGGPQQGYFLNTLWVFETVLAPEAVLETLKAAEQFQGRRRAEKNGPREIDLDLAAYDEILLQKEGLCVPHERMYQRWFVLKPLCDVAPTWRHPLLNKTASELLSRLPRSEEGILYAAQQPLKEPTV